MCAAVPIHATLPVVPITAHHRRALVRPDRLEGLTANGVRKKIKQLSFAAAVNRDDIVAGSADPGVELDEHIAFCIAAMREVADDLGLTPQARE